MAGMAAPDAASAAAAAVQCCHSIIIPPHNLGLRCMFQAVQRCEVFGSINRQQCLV